MTEETKSKKTTVKKAQAPKVEQPAVAPATTGQRQREGVVLSNKMQKTLIVQVTRQLAHPDFKKVIRRNVKYAVHDEKNEAQIGDKVRIIETRPLSKTKRWRLLQVLEKVSK